MTFIKCHHQWLNLVVFLCVAVELLTTPAFAKSNSDIRKDLAKTISNFQQKSAGNPRSMAALAEYYNSGIGGLWDKGKALSLYKKSAAAGDAVAIYYMGEFHENGLDVNYDGVFDIPIDRRRGQSMKAKSALGIAKIAKQGDGEALYLMGMFHRTGQYGFSKDRKTARKYFAKAANKKYAKGLFMLGEYQLQEGSKKLEKACDKFFEAAVMKYSRAGYAYAYCLDKGRGRAQNSKRAAEEYQNAANNHSVLAMLKVAKSLGFKQSSKEEQAKAQKYFDMALREGGTSAYGDAAAIIHKSKRAYYYQRALAANLDNKTYVEKVKSLRETDDKIIGIPEGKYTRKDLLSLGSRAASGHAGANEYIKDFMLMGYIKSTSPVELMTLSSGFTGMPGGGYGEFLYFSDDNKTLTISHEFSASMVYQIVNSTWDTKTGELISFHAFKPIHTRMAISSDGLKFVLKTYNYKFWEHVYSNSGILSVNDSGSGKQLFAIKAPYTSLMWHRINFFGADKYISAHYDYIFFKGDEEESRTTIYDANTGKEIETHSGILEHRLSPDGLSVATLYEPGHGKKEPEPAFKYSRLPNWYGGTKMQTEFSEEDEKSPNLEFTRTMDQSIFSPDSKYWITPTLIYDLKAKKSLGKHSASQYTSVAFERIPKSNLIVRVYDDAINTYVVDGTSIVKVSSLPFDVKWDKRERTYLFSPDYTHIAIRGVRAGSTNNEIYIQSYKMPLSDRIRKKLSKQKEKDKANHVLEMFKVGFDDQAIGKMKTIIANDPLELKYSLNLLKKRDEISATAIGKVIAMQSKMAREHEKVITLGVSFEKVEASKPGTGAAVVKTIIYENVNFVKAGGKIGDRIISLNGHEYFFIKSSDFKEYSDSIKDGQTINLVVERAGKKIPLSYKAQKKLSKYGYEQSKRLIFWHGLMANAAGHPDIAKMDAKRIEQLSAKKPNGIYAKVNKDDNQQMAMLLNAVAIAQQGDHTKAYNLLLSTKTDKSTELWGFKHLKWNPGLFAVLYKDPVKLAYIWDKKVEDLPKVKYFKKVKKSDFWTLDGRLIKLGETAKDNSGGGIVID
ncbi:MAG: hypothetical protein COC03_05070 [Robiginitomaculum sp.]|nr:MAG: hypothetical protein COC03_05070 [Robiginitomaculum sp.]PHQ66845.1 MAG: hypothetical protein COB92_06375 [Robiginitomaculum sp.]